MSRVEFLVKIGNYKVSPFALTDDELRQDVESA
jgi:hypothetical protein